jgi:hypothetical protein
MKPKRFKLERKVLEELKSVLWSYNLKAKILNAFIAENYINDNYYHILLRKYQDTLDMYNNELQDILVENKGFFLVSEDHIKRLNNYKIILNSIEDTVNSSNIFSLKVH